MSESPDIYAECLDLVMGLIQQAGQAGIYSRDTFKGTDETFNRIRSEWVDGMARKVDQLAEKYGTKKKNG